MASQVRAILGRHARQRDVERDVRASWYFIRRAERLNQSPYNVQTKRQKAAAKRLSVALRRLKIALGNPDLIAYLKWGLPDKSQLNVWLERTDAAAETKLGKPRRAVPGKEVAAEQAADLLLECNLPLNVTRGGKFCRLAAVLYGDESADLFRQCQAYKKRHPFWDL